MTYPNTASPLASATHRPAARTPLLRRLAWREVLHGEFREMAKRLLKSVPDLTEPERQWLYDVGREEPRYRHTNIERLVDLSNRSTSAADRSHLAELFRAWTTPSAPPLPLVIASNRETAATGPCDVAIRELEQNPTPAAKARALATAREQLVATRDLIDSVLNVEV